MNQHSPTKQHRYVHAIQQIYDEAGMRRGNVVIMNVMHDDWCNLLTKRANKICNCNPKIEYKKEPSHDR